MWVAPDPDPGEPVPEPGPHADVEFDRLFLTYFNRLRRYAYRYVRSWEEAEDVVHDVFVQLWARRADLAAIDDVEAYLYTAARNRALARLKHLTHERRWQVTQAAAPID